MSAPTDAGGRVIGRLMAAGESWEQYDVDAVAAECLTVLGVDPAEVAALDLLQVAAKHRRDLRAAAPCPSWCTEGSRHAYAAAGRHEFCRTHRRLIGQSDSLGVEVEIQVIEEKDAEGVVTVEEPIVWISLDQTGRDHAELRRIAALLLDSAEAAEAALGERQWTEDDL